MAKKFFVTNREHDDQLDMDYKTYHDGEKFQDNEFNAKPYDRLAAKKVKKNNPGSKLESH